MNRVNLKQARTAHEQWWQDFWNRSWIHVAGTATAEKVSQGYVMQRYMMACSSRGEMPVKFNGGLFTVGHDSPANTKQTDAEHDPDYRRWGNSYWNQNNRLLYWPLIATGDNDLLKPWFEMYLKALPLAKDRTQLYYHHDGASLPETMHFWGLPRLNDFGRNNPTNEIQSRWQKYHIQGTLEVIAQMLDVYDCNRDTAFCPQFAGSIRRCDCDFLRPTLAARCRRQNQDVTRRNPWRLINSSRQPHAGHRGIDGCPAPAIGPAKKLDLGKATDCLGQNAQDLPPIPLRQNRQRKSASAWNWRHQWHADNSSRRRLWQDRQLRKPRALRRVSLSSLWRGQTRSQTRAGHICRATSPAGHLLGTGWNASRRSGFTAVAQKAATDEFTNYGNQRFAWFWKPAHDYIPDLDNGGSGMITLQLMLMQCDGRRIQLLPAWPADWTADFKLHAPYQTTVEGHVENRKITNLKVTPESRAGDVVIAN